MKRTIISAAILAFALNVPSSAFQQTSSALSNMNYNSVPSMQKPSIVMEDEKEEVKESIGSKRIMRRPERKDPEELLGKGMNFWLNMLESDNPLMRAKAEKILIRLADKFGDVLVDKLLNILKDGADDNTFESIKNILTAIFEIPSGDIFSSEIFQGLWDIVHDSNADMTGRIQAANILLNLGIPDAVDFASDFLEGVIEGHYAASDSDIILAASTLLDINYCPTFVMEVLSGILSNDPSEEMAEAIMNMLVEVFEVPANGDIFDSAIFQMLWNLITDQNADITGRIYAARIALNLGVPDAVDFASDFLEVVIEGRSGASESDIILAAKTLLEQGYCVEYVIETLANSDNINIVEAFAEVLIDFFSDSENYQRYYNDFINATYNTILPSGEISLQVKALILYVHEAVNPDGGSYDGLEAILVGDWNGATIEDRSYVAGLFGKLGYYGTLINMLGEENPVLSMAVQDSLVEAYDVLNQEGKDSMINALMNVALTSDNTLARMSAISVLRRLGVTVPRKSRSAILRMHGGTF